jgi:hypothetical protein
MTGAVSGLDILELDGYADGADARGMLNGIHICVCMYVYICVFMVYMFGSVRYC